MTIYIDLDGPLLDAARRYHAVYLSLVTELGGAAPAGLEAYWTLKRARRKETEICRDLHPEIDPRLYSRLFLERIESPEYLARDRLVAGAAATLASLRGRHKLVLATLRRKGGPMREQIAALGLDRLLDGVLQREDNDGDWRRKAEMILAEESKRGGPGLPGVLVGDTEGDLMAARSSGLVGVGVCNGIRSRAVLERFDPHCLVETIRQLPACLPRGAGRAGGLGLAGA